MKIKVTIERIPETNESDPGSKVERRLTGIPQSESVDIFEQLDTINLAVLHLARKK